MNAVFIHKRNESVNRMWACLAGAEFAVWVVSSLPLDMDNGLTNLLVLVFPLCAFCLVIAALFHYVVACEHYASAKGSKKPSESAGMANLFSLFVSLFLSLCPWRISLSGSLTLP
jgi:succinate dehydrogenase/fumarate reductase cytochrome b subunit